MGQLRPRNTIKLIDVHVNLNILCVALCQLNRHKDSLPKNNNRTTVLFIISTVLVPRPAC